MSPLSFPQGRSLPAVLLLFSAALLPLGAQTIVYDAPVAILPDFSEPVSADTGLTFEPEVGSGVHLAGASTEIGSASIPFFSLVPGNATITFSLYGADSSSTSTGSGSALFSNLRPDATPLYTSSPQTMSLQGSGPGRDQYQTLVFSGINTLVPQNFFWTLTIRSVTFDTPPEAPIQGRGGIIGPVYSLVSQLSPAGTQTSSGIFYQRNPTASDAYPATPWTGSGLDLPNPSHSQPPADFSKTYTLAATFTSVPEASAAVLAAGGALLSGLRRRRP